MHNMIAARAEALGMQDCFDSVLLSLHDPTAAVFLSGKLCQIHKDVVEIIKL